MVFNERQIKWLQQNNWQRLKKREPQERKTLLKASRQQKRTTRKAPAKRKPVARRAVTKKPAKKRASTGGVVYAQKGDGTKYYYTGKSGKEALNSDRATAKKVGYITAAGVAKKLISKVPAGYGIHYTGKKR